MLRSGTKSPAEAGIGRAVWGQLWNFRCKWCKERSSLLSHFRDDVLGGDHMSIFSQIFSLPRSFKPPVNASLKPPKPLSTGEMGRQGGCDILSLCLVQAGAGLYLTDKQPDRQTWSHTLYFQNGCHRSGLNLLHLDMEIKKKYIWVSCYFPSGSDSL